LRDAFLPGAVYRDHRNGVATPYDDASTQEGPRPKRRTVREYDVRVERRVRYMGSARDPRRTAARSDHRLEQTIPCGRRQAGRRLSAALQFDH
jgi:hypothetical protein